MTRALAVSALALCLAACSRQEPASLPGPSSALTESAALALAGRITQSIHPPLSFDSVHATGSMRPAIDERSIVLFEPYYGQALRVGDIVEFHRDGRRVLHRIIELRTGGVVTKGDANESSDPFVRYSQISRRYVGQIVFSPNI